MAELIESADVCIQTVDISNTSGCDNKTIHNDICLPVSIFNNDSLSSLETISKYLVEELRLRYCEIAGILNRDERTIWGSYNHARRKMTERFTDISFIQTIPISILRDRTFSVLETITKYLKDELNYRYCRIADILNRDSRTIWTVYHRAKRKSYLKNGEH